MIIRVSRHCWIARTSVARLHEFALFPFAAFAKQEENYQEETGQPQPEKRGFIPLLVARRIEGLSAERVSFVALTAPGCLSEQGPDPGQGEPSDGHQAEEVFHHHMEV